MEVRADFEGFEWARGRYTLSKDRQRIERDLAAPLADYNPDATDLAKVLADPLLLGKDTAALALHLAHKVGFLTVNSDATDEPVAEFLRAARSIAATDALAVLLGDGGPKVQLPKTWTEFMETAAISGEVTAGGRVLRGADKRAHELALERQRLLEARDQKLKVKPPSAAEKASAEAAMRHKLMRFTQLRVTASFDAKAKPPVFTLRPATLADWCWYKLAGVITRTVGLRKCANPRCGRIGEYRRIYCNETYDACKQAVHNAKKAKARKAKTRKAIKPGGSK